MDEDADPFFIGISASYFSIRSQEFCLPTKDDPIAFKPACSSGKFTYAFRLTS